MLRIARRTLGRIRNETRGADGELADPGAGVAVTVSRIGTDGTVTPLVNGAADNAGVGEYTFDVPPPHTDTLGVLLAEWTYTLDAVPQTVETWHEVVGAHITELGTLRRLEPLDDDLRYPAHLVELGRDIASYAIEDACATAFVRRRRIDSNHDVGKFGILTRSRDVELVAMSDSAGLIDHAVAGWRVGKGGLVLGGAGRLWAPVTFTYEHGYNAPPPRVARATALLAREWLQENIDEGISPRATIVTSDAGTMRLVTAGEFGRGFDLPEVNAVVQDYGE